jgi:HSP20 family protein
MLERFLPGQLRSGNEVEERGNQLREVFQDFWKRPLEFPFAGGYPNLDLSENDKEIVVKAELPGLDAKDVELTVQDDALLIRGEKKREHTEEQEDFHRMELSWGGFFCRVPLPVRCEADKVEAGFDKGVLTVTCPKNESAKGRKVTIEE